MHVVRVSLAALHPLIEDIERDTQFIGRLNLRQAHITSLPSLNISLLSLFYLPTCEGSTNMPSCVPSPVLSLLYCML